MKFTYSFFLLILLAVASLCSTPRVYAQGAPLIPLVMVSFVNDQPVHPHSSDGKFAAISVNSGETADIRLHFPAVYAGTPLVIEAMDGGNVVLIEGSGSIDRRGRASFQFQAGNGSGSYRVLILAGGTPSILQFSVPSQ